MSGCFDYRDGDSPLLISVPHDGRNIPSDIAARMTPVALSIPDTDWHVVQLYGFGDELNASMIIAKNSRYVVDLNRPISDAALYEGQVSTGLCPEQTFGGEDLYQDGGTVSATDKERRVENYWRPYHDQIDIRLRQLKERFGYALLWDAHSIPSYVPSLFPGELPELNLGTNDGVSCPANVRDAIADVATSSSFSAVIDGRFRGGYITRHYGSPNNGQYAVQLELAQRCYMDEESQAFDEGLAERLRGTLREMLAAFMQASARR